MMWNKQNIAVETLDTSETQFKVISTLLSFILKSYIFWNVIMLFKNKVWIGIQSCF